MTPTTWPDTCRTLGIVAALVAVVIAGVLEGHDGWLIVTAVGILGGLLGWNGQAVRSIVVDWAERITKGA